ncbi:MAG: HAMP domain-containing protein [Desulfobacterales bacterium]|nr:HAMP domain-containing protein [Desulfobacterales bacterium]
MPKRTFIFGLRTEILLSLTVLLVAAMTLTSFVILRITERDLLRYKTADGMAVVQRIQAAVGGSKKQASPASLKLLKERLRNGISWMGHSGLYDEILVVGRDGSLWVGEEHPKWSNEPGDNEIASVLRTAKPSTKINRERTLVTVTAPIFANGQCIAAVRVPVRIDAMSQGLRKSRTLIWFYIGLNVLVLVVFGNFLLSRIVIRPIQRLVRIADHFEETDLFSMMTRSDQNEIAHLTMALNRMLKRLAENKERLEAHIRSLETANLELKQAREEVLRSEKLSSLGRLAAGVAHEVGNPIGAVLGYTNLLADHVAGNTEAIDYLGRIEKEVTRINTIIRELLDFSRPSPSEPAPLDVNALIMESTSFLSGQSLMASIKIETQLEQGVGMVWADANQLKQVLINLMLNACDAMEEGGSLAIASKRISPVKETTGSDQHPTEFIQVSVSDTGKGIAASELNKIFDPFYTTKPPGKGTGLGLAISVRIVETFGGSIYVESTEGKGSTFTVELPPWEPDHDTK